MNQGLTHYPLYLSCSWYFDNAYNDLFRLLDGIEGFHYSISTLSTQIIRSQTLQGRFRYERIKEKMDACGALLVLGGVYPLYQDWISKEIMACKSEGDKPLIVVIRDSSLQISPVVRQYADRLVGWDAELIAAGVRELVI